MRKQLTATVVVLSLFMGNLPSVSANDLVDFLNALHAISNAAAQRDHHDQHHRLAYRTASSPYLIAPSYSRRDSGIRISVGPQSSHSLFHSSRRPSSRIERHYHVGDIVTHPVRLSHCVRIRNPHRIAPDAIGRDGGSGSALLPCERSGAHRFCGGDVATVRTASAGYLFRTQSDPSGL